MKLESGGLVKHTKLQCSSPKMTMPTDLLNQSHVVFAVNKLNIYATLHIVSKTLSDKRSISLVIHFMDSAFVNALH